MCIGIGETMIRDYYMRDEKRRGDEGRRMRRICEERREGERGCGCDVRIERRSRSRSNTIFGNFCVKASPLTHITTS